MRPLLRRVTDRQTGHVEEVAIPCGSTRESVCPSCADKARRLRMQQRAEGWHLEEDPLDAADSDQARDNHGTDADDDGDGAAVPGEQAEASGRRVRSTRRRGDVVGLPRKLMEDRTVGKVFTSPDGRAYRPSMFVTLTLGSYGRVISARKGRHVVGAGAPVDPGSYDYRRAALEALHFPKLFDRWMQNLRRCAGFRVQYFGAVEPQRRLAPHIHVAMRGAIPRQVIRQVTSATYLQLWWPRHDHPVYLDQTPTWDPVGECYRDPQTGERLPTWAEALDALEEDPAGEASVVMRFGAQTDIKGIIAPSKDADRAIRYLTKYLTKAVSQTYTDPDHADVAYEAHIDRLHEQVLYLPCTPQCPNWLRFGVQPKNPGPGMRPGWCSSRVHDRENLGLGGRRVQVSRAWSGKTLREHKADRATVVREVLEAAGVEVPPADRLSAAVPDADGEPRFVWEDLPVGTADYVRVVASSVQQAQRWRRQYDEAKEHQGVGARASPTPGPRACGQSFGNHTPRAPDSQRTPGSLAGCPG